MTGTGGAIDDTVDRGHLHRTDPEIGTDLYHTLAMKSPEPDLDLFDEGPGSLGRDGFQADA